MSEVHVHFSAGSRAERLDIETDLRRGHRTPLNYQPTPAPSFLADSLGSFGTLGIANPAVDGVLRGLFSPAPFGFGGPWK